MLLSYAQSKHLYRLASWTRHTSIKQDVRFWVGGLDVRLTNERGIALTAQKNAYIIAML